MVIRYFYLICLMLFLTEAWAQKTLPATFAEFEVAFLNMKDEPTPEQVKQAKIDFYTKRIQQQFANPIVGGPVKANSFDQEARVKEFVDCLQNALKGSLTAGLNCREDWKALMKGDSEELRRRGLPLPDDFVIRMRDELKNIQDEVASYQKDDEVIVIDEFMAFEATGPETLLNAQAIDPSIVSLSHSMKEIVLKMYKSDDPIKAIAGIKEKGGDDKVPDELFVLGEMLELITGSNCAKEADYRNDMGQYLLKDMAKKLEVEDEEENKNLPPNERKKSKFNGNYLIGIKTDDPLNTIPTYRFTEDGITYYLYQGKKRSSEEVWVMAKLLPDGKMEFDYFKLIQDQPDKTSMKSKNDIALLESGVHQTTTKLPNDKKFYFQAQEGLVIRADEVSAPVLGKAVIPEAKLVLSRVHMAYLTKNTLSQANISVRHDDVLLETQSKPLSGAWSVGGNLRYSPINGGWDASGNVRVQNLLVGYGLNGSGNSSANMSYILSRNFVTVQSDVKNDTKMTLGRQFSNGRGFVMGSTNFKGVTEVKLVIFVK